jgi:hypothetical protein
MSIFVFFYQDKRLECSINVRSFIYNKTVLLSNSKKFSIFAKLGSNYWSFKIILRNNKHAFQIKNYGITSHIDGNHNNRIFGNYYIFYLMRSLEWQYLGLVSLKINAFNCVCYRAIQNLVLYI